MAQECVGRASIEIQVMLTQRSWRGQTEAGQSGKGI
jgi:hypothetical protein